jgi:hypothetical protein
MTDPRFTDPRLGDLVIRRDEAVGEMWGWIAGVAVVPLIGFLIIAGWNSSNTASSGSSTTSAHQHADEVGDSTEHGVWFVRAATVYAGAVERPGTAEERRAVVR